MCAQMQTTDFLLRRRIFPDILCPFFSISCENKVLLGTVFPDNLCPDTYFRPRGERTSCAGADVLPQPLKFHSFIAEQKWHISPRQYNCRLLKILEKIHSIKDTRDGNVCIPPESINGASAESAVWCKYASTAWEVAVILEPLPFYSAPGSLAPQVYLPFVILLLPYTASNGLLLWHTWFGWHNLHLNNKAHHLKFEKDHLVF